MTDHGNRRECFCRPASGRRLLQSDVGSVVVIKGQIVTPKPPQMLLIQGDRNQSCLVGAAPATPTRAKTKAY
jgi:hypothetical protein